MITTAIAGALRDPDVERVPTGESIGNLVAELVEEDARGLESLERGSRVLLRGVDLLTPDTRRS